ncbi:epidermal growth factor receptor kinase substrate 8-like protein 3b isoform X1 [Solea solea]|uniref:epidermal growth factor receptor kinase substrate 8-like protein 3b isoform X1 n=1 Tax=Solea solea TaxID=90069 RepID=UPI00272B3602|nr:epidermal growth factor receptor kinase substrate 8-like protein 3b isoform X1 [Solea solea]
MFGNTAPFSYSPRGFSPEDFPQQRRAFQQDDLKAPPLQRNGLSRPSGKFIYRQRKEYSETLNRQTDNLHVRVEHLFTCEIDGEAMKRLEDCVAKLKRLDTKGRLWPQEMIMEVQGGYVLLSDIESKIELESLPLSNITQTKAMLDSCSYNSLLIITVQEHRKRFPQVYMFQCEEIKADVLKSDLDKVIPKRGAEVEPHLDQLDIRSNRENIIGRHSPGGFQQAEPRPAHRELILPPSDHLTRSQWESMSLPVYSSVDEMLRHPDPRETQTSPELQNNTDVLNHVIGDIEIFIGKVSSVGKALPSQKEKKKNMFKMEKAKKNASADYLPPWQEYMSCLQKIKYGFNLLAQLDGVLNSPTAQDFVHIFFSCLAMLVPRYPADLPPTVISPQLSESAVWLLSDVVTPEEDQLWKSLGEPWNVPRSRWARNDVPPYIPQFYDGWQPPPPSHIPPRSRNNSQRYSSDGPNRNVKSVSNSARNSPTSVRESPLLMRVIYTFMARNNQELSVMKDDVVQVIQKSKQWWLVRNNQGQEGSVPQNVLEPMRNTRLTEDMLDTRGPVTLDMSSSPSEVRAWLQHKGFSKITVSSLGVLNGKLLLGMTKEEIRTVCPEEGGKVFFQLQGVKSAVALASEPSNIYNTYY